jgi:hypothetical protein
LTNERTNKHDLTVAKIAAALEENTVYHFAIKIEIIQILTSKTLIKTFILL